MRLHLGFMPLNHVVHGLIDRVLRGAVDAIQRGVFNPEDPGCFQGMMEDLVGHDSYLLFADFKSYAACQAVVEAAYRDQTSWTQKSILNVARMGFFSSDRTIAGYAKDIWDVVPQQRR